MVDPGWSIDFVGPGVTRLRVPRARGAMAPYPRKLFKDVYNIYAKFENSTQNLGLIDVLGPLNNLCQALSLVTHKELKIY
jgi:hypothetical protein